MLVSDFHFELPEELIAQHPPLVRGSSRMLVLDRATGALRDDHFANLPGYLGRGDLLILNDSRVLPARLFAMRAGIGRQVKSPTPSGLIEVLLVERMPGDRAAAAETWRALVKPARKVRIDERLLFFAVDDGQALPVLTATVVAEGEFGERILCFDPVADFYGAIGSIGHMPLPPYIHRNQAKLPATVEDRERYQTVYSQAMGSAAAPTAGLHFTAEVLAALIARGVEIEYITLHVGLGTFQPVRVASLEQIRLHAEHYTLPATTAEAINRAVSESRRIIAVGTTTTRTLEHIAEAGGEHFEPHSGSTSIFIAPGHEFRVVGGLLTNFHLPESTLLMLVSAFAGGDADQDRGRQMILSAYAHAIEQGYRFYSYGDCMLLL